jgi:hypothetical protein
VVAELDLVSAQQFVEILFQDCGLLAALGIPSND